MEATRVSRLNAVIHERARLGIMSVLAAQPALSFTELKALLGMTDGNLSVHLKILDKSKYVSIEKKFVDRKPPDHRPHHPQGKDRLRPLRDGA